ncbi:MAG: DUF4388 domain-containing protein [Deltaproteobacteria bacterium]|nr:DUF4388 domain-containing protein [Deltaproteobacteria bacterium]
MLVIEPNPGILIVARNVLMQAGFDVVAVAGPREAEVIVQRRAVDVVLVDAAAPLDVVTVLRGGPVNPVQLVATRSKTRILKGMSSLAPQSASDRRFFADMIDKPFAPDELVTAVLRAVERRRNPSQLAGTADATGTARRSRSMRSMRSAHSGPRSRSLPVGFGDPGRSSEDLEGEFWREIEDQVAGESHESVAQDGVPELERSLAAALFAEGVAVERKALAAMVRVCAAAIQGSGAPSFARVEHGAFNDAAIPKDAEADGHESSAGILAVAGDLRHVTLDQVLQLCTGFEGVARCRLEQRDGGVIEIYFRENEVIFGRASHLPEGFMLGRLLVAAGVLDDAQVEATIALTGHGERGGPQPQRVPSGVASGAPGVGALGEWMGQRLVRLGLITETDLRQALVRQTEELVYEAVRWMDGRFRIYASATLPVEGQSAGVRIPFHHLLLEGMRRLDEWARISAEMGGPGAKVRRVAFRDSGDSQERIGYLPPEDRLVLDRLHDRSTVMDLVHRVRRPTYDVLCTIHRLAVNRLVEVESMPLVG